MTEGIGELHQRGAACAGLQVFQRQALERFAKAGLELACIGGDQLLDRMLVESDAQIAAQQHGVVDRACRGIAGRHGDADHVVRSQGIDGQGQRQCRIDAARAADHHLLETAAARIVAQAQHDLLAVELHGGQALRRHGRQGRAVAGLKPALRIQLQCADIFLKAPGFKHQARLGLDGKRGAVEHDLVLAADLVDVEDGQLVACRRLGEDLVTLLALAQVAGAGVDADDQVGGRIAHAYKGVGGVVGALVVPAVLADQKAHLAVAHAQHLGRVGPGLEVAALVKDVVGGQQLLVVLQADLSVLEHQQAVVQRFAGAIVARGCAHDPVQIGELARGLQQLLQTCIQSLQKAGLVQQVAGVVAAQRQFGKHHQVGLFGRRPGRGFSHAADIAADVAHHVVELGEGDFQHGCLRRFRLPWQQAQGC